MRFKFVSFAAVAAVGGFLIGWLPGQPTDVVFFSVGQGDSALIQAEGVNVLVDAGPAKGGYDAGRTLVVPKLRERGVDRLSILFLTHPDSDHVGGVGAVLKRYPEAKVVLNAAFREHEDLIEDLRKWRLAANRVVWVSGESVWRFGNAQIRCYAPDVVENDNEGSLFLKLEDGGATAVLNGDAPATTEDRTATVDDWSAQVMAAGHHGSRTSASSAWLAEVKPRYVAISCGRDNSYGHPHRETLDLLRSEQIEVHRTDQEGDLRFVAEGGRFVFRP